MGNKEEILHYLGKGQVDETLERMINRGEQELLAVAAPKHVSCQVSLQVEGHLVIVDQAELVSADLASHLSGCTQGFLLACTLGPGVDRLIKRLTITELPMAPVVQACAAVLIEEYCDSVQQEMVAYAGEKGLFLRPRYSPGYGDFPLSAQNFFFQRLEISKKIGISLTDSFLMVPFKSITAIIGLSADASLCHVGRCMLCSANNCPFRKVDAS